MSTTKLPEAFEPRPVNFRKDLGIDHPVVSYANGYNACLEATGAKELWEANKEAAELLAMVGASDSFARLPETVQQWVARAFAALSKSNPSNTLG